MFGRVRGELEAVAARFDPALVDARTAAEIREDATAMKNIAAAIEARAMARIAETEIWRESGVARPRRRWLVRVGRRSRRRRPRSGRREAARTAGDGRGRGAR
jgi:hypothetical protein